MCSSVCVASAEVWGRLVAGMSEWMFCSAVMGSRPRAMGNSKNSILRHTGLSAAWRPPWLQLIKRSPSSTHCVRHWTGSYTKYLSGNVIPYP